MSRQLDIQVSISHIEVSVSSEHGMTSRDGRNRLGSYLWLLSLWSSSCAWLTSNNTTQPRYNHDPYILCRGACLSRWVDDGMMMLYTIRCDSALGKITRRRPCASSRSSMHSCSSVVQSAVIDLLHHIQSGVSLVAAGVTPGRLLFPIGSI
jgi:hypothetical protein